MSALGILLSLQNTAFPSYHGLLKPYLPFCSGFSGPPKGHVHLQRQKETLFGIKVFAEVVKGSRLLPPSYGPHGRSDGSSFEVPINVCELLTLGVVVRLVLKVEVCPSFRLGLCEAVDRHPEGSSPVLGQAPAYSVVCH